MDALSWVLGLITSCVGVACGYLTSISLLPLAGALLALTAMQLLRAAAWRNILRAAFPGEQVPYKQLAATYLIGAGVNAVIPAKAGEAVKLFLARREIPTSNYPALTSSLASLTVFDTTVGLLVLAIALHSGVVASSMLPELPLNLIIPGGAAVIAAVSFAAWRSAKVRVLLGHASQGLAVLGRPLTYLRRVASFQALGWCCRFVGFSLMLEAFGIPGTPMNVFLVMSAQAVAGAIPLAPSGAGTQQALLVAMLSGAGKGTILFYSIGAHVATAVCSAALGLAALLFVFKTNDWRELLRVSRRSVSLKAPGREPAVEPSS